MSTFAEHLLAANQKLKLLRGETVNPERVLAEVRSAGCTVEVQGGNLVVSGGLTDDLRAKIRECKPALLRILGEQPVSAASEFDFWDAEDASQTVKLLLARFESQGWPESKDMAQEAGRCMDAIDDALKEQNLAAFKRAVERFLTFMDDQFPKRLGGTTYFEKSDGVCWSAWVRKSGAKKWLRLASGCPDKDGLEEKIHEYTTNVYKADILIIEDGRDPNTEKKSK